LSGVASSFLLFGVALVYTEVGTLSFVANDFGHEGVGAHLFWVVGLAMILTGIGFKLSLVPFHMWAPDVYEGAPAPVSGFVAVVSKTAVAALLLRYAQATGFLHTPSLNLALSVIAIASIIAGNLLALLQTNVKRILAYSSIAHLGYVLVALLAGGALALEAVTAYLVAYAITMLGAFGVVTLLSDTEGEHDTDQIDDYYGLLWSRPTPAVIFAAMLLSLAGIPLTAGFIAKFYVLNAGVDASLSVPVATVVLGSIIGLYYYLRIIVAMAGRPTLRRDAVLAHRLGSFVVAVLAVLLVVVGVYPAPLISTIRATAVALAASPAPAARNGPATIGLER
jgi:NADH-quinone oxidoreductase subunit N